LGGVLTSLDPRALVPAIICFAIDLTLYLPFVFLDNRLFFKRIKLSDRDLYFKELRYSYNAKDHYITQTEEKYQAKIQKANNVVTIANNRNEFIKSLRLKQARKDSIVSKNLHKAELRKTKLLKEAEDYKKNRNQRYNLIENKLTLRNKNLVKKINQKYWRLYKKTNLHNNISQRSIRIKETNLDLLNILSETTANV
jgi:PTS system cellobiose-specific IIC component